MDKITLGDIATALAFIVAFGGSIVAIVAGIKKALKALLKEQMEEINKRMDKTDAKIDKVDYDNCKNFLVQILSQVERGEKLTTEEKIRLAEEFEHYTANGGNSYIKDWHTRLHDEGRI